MQGLLGEQQEVKERPRAQRYPGRPSMLLLFSGIDTGNRQQCGQRIVEAHVTHGYTLKEIADCLGIHYTTVSKIVSKAKDK